MKTSFFQRLRHILFRLRFRPIRVFVFHQVSDVFEPDTMWECDWTQTDVFKENISALMKKYTFISLEEVRRHLREDKFRVRRYAALTSDDGWASLKNILPWLAEQKVPVTLFLNPSCLDGKHWNSRETDKLLTEAEVVGLVEACAPYVSIASHGWTHRNNKEMTADEFAENVMKSEALLGRLPGKVPFYAFASGYHRMWQVEFLRENGLIPAFVDARVNDNDPFSLHRFCIDGIKIHG